jgi:hypothetical protein
MTSREKRLSTIIAILLIVVVIVTTNTTKLEQQVDKLQQPTQQQSIKGEYTLIHYPNGGWTNAIYVTEYYLEGNLTWFMEKGSKEFIPVWTSLTLPVKGWLTDEQLIGYGVWVSELEGVTWGK